MAKAPKGYFYNARGLLVKKLDASTIKAIKSRFPNKTFDFNKFKYGVPQSDPIIDQLRNMSPERMDTIRKRRSQEDYKARRKLEANTYYERNKEKVLQKAKDKYRSSETVGDTGKTLKELTREKNIKAIVKLQKDQGVFPNGYTLGKNRIGVYKPELALWHSLYRSAKDGNGRWTLDQKFFNNLPINEQGNKSWALNNYYKNIKFTDTATGETIKLNDTIKGKGKTLKQYLDTTIAKETGNKNVFNKAKNSYELKNKIKDTTLNYKGQKETLGGLLAKTGIEKTGEKIYSPFEVHHPSGVKNNWWDSEVVFRDANRQLNYIDSKLQRDFKNAKDVTEQNKILSSASKKVNKLPGGISYIFEGQQLGTNIPTEESISKAAATTYKDRGVTRAVNLFFNDARADAANNGPICRIVGSRNTGGSMVSCVDAVEDALQKNPQKLAQEVNQLPYEEGPFNKVKNAATKFLQSPRLRGAGKFGAIAAGGAVAAGFVKQFMNDDPTTYLSNEEQQKNLLMDMVTGSLDDTPQESPAIGDAYLPALGAATVAGTAAVAPSTIDAARSGALGAKKSGITKTALKTLGRGLAATTTPLGLLATEPLYLADQVQQGDSLGEIATNPFNYFGAAFASDADRIVSRGLSPSIAKTMRLGISPTTLKTVSRRFGLPGLALSLGISGYETYDDFKNKRGFFSNEE